MAGGKVVFQGVAKGFFPGGNGARVAKFYFTSSKLREKHFSTKNLMRKYHI